MKNLICDKTQEALAAYLDGDNAALQSAEVQAHLAACEDCQAVYAEVQHALTAGNADESSLAFPQNGAMKSSPDEKYWNELPDRVMARIEGRNSLETKNNAPLPVVPPPKRLRDTSFIKTFAASKTRSVLALTAVVFLMIVVTRTMQDSLPKQERLNALPEAQITAAESGPITAEEKRDAQPSAPAVEQTRSKKISADASEPAMAEDKPAPQPAEAPLTTIDQAASQAKQITPPPEIVLFGKKSSQLDDQPKKSVDELSLAQGDAESLQARLPNEAPASAEPMLPVLTKEAAVERQISKTDAASGSSMRAASQPAKMRAMSTASQAAPSTSESSYSQALWRAQQTATPKAQQVIWQGFLSAASDSTYIKLAIAQLAQSMLAQVDSSSSAEQVKSTLRFLKQHEAILRSQFGVEKLGSEMRRIELLSKP